VLVMDDDPLVHQAIDAVFGNGEQVLHAYSLAAAIECLNEHPVGVIVSDFMVGQMDATRLIRMMKGEHPEIISVVFSAVQDAEYVVKLINEGQVYRFIPKPVKPGFIKLIIGSALKRHVQLLEHPQLVSRCKVETVAAGTADSLLRDVETSAARTAVPPALADRLKAGFRKLFRHA
jgi:serine/threonine-protein kinase